MNKILQDIEAGKYAEGPLRRPRLRSETMNKRKKDWYKIGEVMSREYKVKLHKESKMVA